LLRWDSSKGISPCAVVAVSVTIVELPQTSPLAPYRSHLRSSSTTQSGIVGITVEDGLTGWGGCDVNFLPNLSSALGPRQRPANSCLAATR
jgi:hypothetical protein